MDGGGKEGGMKGGKEGGKEGWLVVGRFHSLFHVIPVPSLLFSLSSC